MSNSYPHWPALKTYALSVPEDHVVQARETSTTTDQRGNVARVISSDIAMAEAQGQPRHPIHGSTATPLLPAPNAKARTDPHPEPHPELKTGTFPILKKSGDENSMRKIEEGFGPGSSAGFNGSNGKRAGESGGRVDHLEQGYGQGKKEEDQLLPTPTLVRTSKPTPHRRRSITHPPPPAHSAPIRTPTPAKPPTPMDRGKTMPVGPRAMRVDPVLQALHGSLAGLPMYEAEGGTGTDTGKGKGDLAYRYTQGAAYGMRTAGALIDQGRKRAARQRGDESRAPPTNSSGSGRGDISTTQPEPSTPGSPGRGCSLDSSRLSMHPDGGKKRDDHTSRIGRGNVAPSRSDDPSRLTLPYGTPLGPVGGSWTGPPRSSRSNVPGMSRISKVHSYPYSHKGPKGASPNLIPLGGGGRGRYTARCVFTGDDRGGVGGMEEEAGGRDDPVGKEKDASDRNTPVPPPDLAREPNTQPPRIHSSSISSDPPERDSPELLDPRVEYGRMGITRATVGELGSGGFTEGRAEGPGFRMDAGEGGEGTRDVGSGMGVEVEEVHGVEVVEVEDEMEVQVESARGHATELEIEVAVVRTNEEDTDPDEESIERKDEEYLPSHPTSPTSTSTFTSTSASLLTTTPLVERCYKSSNSKRHHPDSEHPSSSPIRSRRSKRTRLTSRPVQTVQSKRNGSSGKDQGEGFYSPYDRRLSRPAKSRAIWKLARSCEFGRDNEGGQGCGDDDEADEDDDMDGVQLQHRADNTNSSTRQPVSRSIREAEERKAAENGLEGFIEFARERRYRDVRMRRVYETLVNESSVTHTETDRCESCVDASRTGTWPCITSTTNASCARCQARHMRCSFGSIAGNGKAGGSNESVEMVESRSEEESEVEERASITVRVGRTRKESSSSENKLEVQADKRETILGSKRTNALGVDGIPSGGQGSSIQQTGHENLPMHFTSNQSHTDNTSEGQASNVIPSVPLPRHVSSCKLDPIRKLSTVMDAQGKKIRDIASGLDFDGRDECEMEEYGRTVRESKARIDEAVLMIGTLHAALASITELISSE